MTIPDDLLALLRGAAPCFVATVMPDGSPQLTETWVDTDGENVVINTVEGFQKVRNLRRDPRVSLNVCDPDDESATGRTELTAPSRSSCDSRSSPSSPVPRSAARTAASRRSATRSAAMR